jgi:hypothetical protein
MWTAYRPGGNSDHRITPMRGDALGRQSPRRVRLSIARRGLLAVGPLFAAVATAAVVYGMDVVGDSVPSAMIFAHSGISALALLLVIYKLSDLGVAGLRRAFARQRLTDLVALALVALSVPLATTGVALVFAPGTGSFVSYTHLISSAWWTALMLLHLGRYLGPSLRAVLQPGTRSAPDNRLGPGHVDGSDCRAR